MRTQRQQWRLRLLALALGVAASLIFVELLLQVLPVHEGAHRLPVNEASPVLRFEPNRQFTWSRDWNFSIKNEVNINNYGFVNNVNYEADLNTPLIGVIGDSFIEAFMLPFQQTCAGRLEQSLNETARVYSFAAGGSPLSQYLAYAQYARDTFKPDRLIVTIIGNDFDESLSKYNQMPGNHYFMETQDGELELVRRDFQVSLTKRLARKSALALYLMHNLELGEAPERFLKIFSDETVPSSELELENNDSERLLDSKRAVDKFLQMLPVSAGLKQEQIVLVVDGMRPQLYDDDLMELEQGSYIEVMRSYFMDFAIVEGFEVIDLQPVFSADYKVHQEIFEFPQDAHWNERGHGLCFQEVAHSRTLESIGMSPTAWMSKDLN